MKAIQLPRGAFDGFFSGRSTGRSVARAILTVGLVLSIAACDEDSGLTTPGGGRLPTDECSIPTNNLVSGGVPKDGIPALTDPAFVASEQATYLTDDSRVIGVRMGDEALAIPHNILWFHEIVNLNRAGEQLAVTYCPLTGSSMAFDRSVVDGAEFGVSGLLFQNNLVMYDRTSQESLWPQMNRKAGCGTRDQTPLVMRPVIEMTWKGWRDLHPDTKVISASTGFGRNYEPSGYPYGRYEERNNASLLFQMPIDDRRQPKERVLGIPLGGGIAFPFGELDAGPYSVVSADIAGEEVVVFWDRASRSAMAYEISGSPTSFEARDEGIFDVATSSRWHVDGQAVEGPLQGTRLEPLAEAYVAFWFAWAAFHPDTELWARE